VAAVLPVVGRRGRGREGVVGHKPGRDVDSRVGRVG